MVNVTTINKPDTAWIAWARPRPEARLRLFCFPYAGGGATIFRKWSDSLPETVEVNPVQLPGRGNRLREPPFARLSPLVQAIAAGLLPHLDKPFAFFGHSMGALISFELARLLRRERGIEPYHLFVSGRRAPQILDPVPITYNLPQAKFIENLQKLNGTPAELFEHRELMTLMLPVLRADFEVVQTYAYEEEPALSCSISALGGIQDQEVSRGDLEAWRHQTGAAFMLRRFAGDHFFLNTQQSLFLQMLSQELGQLVSSLD